MAFDVNSMSSNTSFDAALNRMANRVAGFEEEQAQLAESHTTGAANAAVAGGMLAKLDWGNPLALMQELEKQYSQLAQLANSAKRFQDNILSWADKVPMPQFSMGDAGTAQAPMAPVANAGPQIKAHTKIADKPDAPKPGADAPKPEAAGEGKKTEEADAVKKEPLAEKDIEELKKTLADSKYDAPTQEFLLGKIKDKFATDRVKALEVAQSLPPASEDDLAWGNAFGLWLGENFHDLNEAQAKFATGEIAFQDDAQAKFLELESPDVEFDREENAKYTYKVSDSHDAELAAKGDKVFKRGDEWFKDDGSENGKIMKGVQDFDHGSLYFEKGNPTPNFLSPKAYFEGFESGDAKEILVKAKAQKSLDDLLGEKWVEEAQKSVLVPSVKDKIKFEYKKADGDKKARLDIHFSKADKDAVFEWLDNNVNAAGDAGLSSPLSSLASNFKDKEIEVWLNDKRKVDGFTTNATKALRDLVKDEAGEDAAAPAPAAAESVPAAEAHVRPKDVDEKRIQEWRSGFASNMEGFHKVGATLDEQREALIWAQSTLEALENRNEAVGLRTQFDQALASFQSAHPGVSIDPEATTLVDAKAEESAAPVASVAAPAVAAEIPAPRVVVSGPAEATVEAVVAAPADDSMDFSETEIKTWEPSAADKKLKAEFDMLAGRYTRCAKAYDQLLTDATTQGKTKAFVDEQEAKRDYDKVVADFRANAKKYLHVEGYDALYNKFSSDQTSFKDRYIAVNDMNFDSADIIQPERKLLESYTKIAKAFDDPKATQVDLKAKLDLLDAMRNQLKLAVEDANAHVFIGGVEYMKRDLKSFDVANKIQTLYTDALIKYSRRFGVPTPSASLDTPTEFTVGALSPEDLAKKLHGSFS